MARRRRSRAKENPSAGFWVAVAVGVVAVGGVAYVMTRPSTAAAATNPLPPSNPTHPTNDAATNSGSLTAAQLQAMTPAQSAAFSQSIADSLIAAEVTLSYTVNGRQITEKYLPQPPQLANDMARAHQLASVGHGAGKEGETWVARAKVDGATSADLAQLRTDGYSV